MRPVFQISPKILTYVEEISLILGKLDGIRAEKPQPLLRKKNRIRTVHGSIGIEGNTLSIDQVTALIEGKRVIGSKKDIQEVINANHLYEISDSFDYRLERDLLRAHKVLMKGLIPDAGRYRSKAVGVLDRTKVIHIAPRSEKVSLLMQDLLDFLNKDKEINLLLKSAIFHYETEFIHPFSDGNGRLGRFWQHLILEKVHPIFQYCPFESMIRQCQKKYYEALHNSDQKGDCSDFIEFSLKMIFETLFEFESQVKPSRLTRELRLEKGHGFFRKKSFSRKDYIALLKTISTATASRDLQEGIKKSILKKTGSRSVTRYQYERRSVKKGSD